MTQGGHDPEGVPGNLCFAHWTADLQLAAMPLPLTRNVGDAPVLLLPRRPVQLHAATGLLGAPPGEPPPRIRLHAFLV